MHLGLEYIMAKTILAWISYTTGDRNQYAQGNGHLYTKIDLNGEG